MDNRYAPPKSEVADVLRTEPKRWARAAWVHLIVFAGLIVLAFAEADAVAHGLTTASGWGIAAALALTAVLLYFPARSLRALSETAAPWWAEALIYAAPLTFLVGIEVGDANLAVAGATPVLLVNGIVGILAMMTERRHGLRVYVSGRRYVFSRKSSL